MKLVIASLIIAAASMAAHATQPGNNGGGQGGCGNGQTTNGCPGNGGAGGAGGQGGTGLGVGVGLGVANAAASAAATGGNAAVVGSGNSNVRNTNNNANLQGQQQGQAQSSRNSNRNANTSTSSATGGAGGQATATSGGNTMTAGAVTVEGDKGDLVYAPAQERAPVSTAYAAPLTATNGTCMGSSSGGFQGAALGLSIGSTWTDPNCDIRYDAEALRAAGLRDAAQARLCQKKEIADAMAAAGTPCTDKTAKRAEGYGLGAPVAVNSGSNDAKYQDPIIRARLGLPPLK